MSGGEWTVLFEELLRGLAHALNNRVTALSACAELAAIDGEPVDANVLKMEITRLHQVSALVGGIATRGHDAEALEIRPVLEEALAIYHHHPRMRSDHGAIAQSGLVLPVRVPRGTLLRLLLLMIDAMRRSADRARVEVRLAGDEQLVTVEIETLEPSGGDAVALAAACGGVVKTAGGVWRLELPSLLALRRQERTPLP